jgi:DNA-binding transcriptional ArsR family regulator
VLADAAIAPVASLLSDPSRVSILLALSDGREIAAGELALVAGVTAATASFHLARLTSAALVTLRRQGRHRLYRLAAPEVVQALEALAVLAPQSAPRTHRQARIGRAVRAGRTCYDHLAGRLGVCLARALLDRGAIRLAGAEFDVTPLGEHLLGELGIDLPAARARRRAVAAACLDWSEREPHIAGALGAALLTRLFDLGWIQRMPASRAVEVTSAGRRGLHRTFGIAPDS